MAAKGKYSDWITDDGLTLIRGWARDGLTDADIADNIGISCTTLYEWKKRFPDISEALKSGKEVADYKVENALYAKALAGDVADIKAWVDNIPDSLTRRIIRHKYIYRKKDVTWLDVVKTMYPDLRPDKQFKMTESIKKKYTRFLKKFKKMSRMSRFPVL